tara:strand:+ start:215 stop:448 length:234 start_codon:yes stop_codon:yes gene_type:complete
MPGLEDMVSVHQPPETQTTPDTELNDSLAGPTQYSNVVYPNNGLENFDIPQNGQANIDAFKNSGGVAGDYDGIPNEG